jgi:hypothetical protein
MREFRACGDGRKVLEGVGFPDPFGEGTSPVR